MLIANIVGFGTVAANDIVGVVTGEAREAAKIFLIVHLAFTVALVLSAKLRRRMAE